MKKQIRKIGNSCGIIFNLEDMRIYRFNLGDIIDIEPVIIRKGKREVQDGREKN